MGMTAERIHELNTERIALLHPKLQDRATEFVQLCEKENGVLVLVTETLRSFDKQAEYYASGRTKPGKIITKAKPGSSYHQYGLALDHVPMHRSTGNLYTTDWSRPLYLQRTIPVALALGWESLAYSPTFPETPHLQIREGWHWRELLSAGYGKTRPYQDIPFPKP